MPIGSSLLIARPVDRLACVDGPVRSSQDGPRVALCGLRGPSASADQERGQHSAERAEQVRLPGHRDHAGDVGGRHPDDPGPEQAAAERRAAPGRAGCAASVRVKMPRDDQVGQPAEHHAGRADRDGAGRRRTARRRARTPARPAAVTATNCRRLPSMISTPKITSGTRLDHRCAQRAVHQRRGQHPDQSRPGRAARCRTGIEPVDHRRVDDCTMIMTRPAHRPDQRGLDPRATAAGFRPAGRCRPGIRGRWAGLRRRGVGRFPFTGCDDRTGTPNRTAASS